MHGIRIIKGAHARAAGAQLADEAGSFLIEALVSSVILLVVGTGILTIMDRGSQLSGQQRGLAMAGNVAESEQETLRAWPLSSLSNLRRTDTLPVAGVNYEISSRTDWINDDSGEPNCSTAGASADYLKLTTTVTSGGMDASRPVVLESLITPPARSLGPDQGSLAVQVDDAAGDPLPGLTMSLTGSATHTDATNANGCILWGYLAEGGGYTVSATRAGYVQPNGNGSSTIAAPASVLGDQTANVNLEYDRGGAIAATFTTQRPRTTTSVNSTPQEAMLEHPNAKFVARAFPVADSSLNSGLVLFPFASPYTIYAGGCPAARPPAAKLGSAIAPAGSTSAEVTVQLPVIDRVIRYNNANLPSGIMKATGPCGSPVYTRTITNGALNDPGFPYGTLTNVCVSGTVAGIVRKLVIGTLANTTYTYSAGSTPAVSNIGTATGAC